MGGLTSKFQACCTQEKDSQESLAPLIHDRPQSSSRYLQSGAILHVDVQKIVDQELIDVRKAESSKRGKQAIRAVHLDKTEYEFIDEATFKIGKSGGKFNLAGCQLSIPAGALAQTNIVTVTSFYGKAQKSECLTPVLQCQPEDLEFNKPIKIILPTCYRTQTGKKIATNFRQRTKTNWKTLAKIDLLPNTKSFTAQTTKLGTYDVIILGRNRCENLLKEKSLIVTKCPAKSIENTTSVSIQLCDNIKACVKTNDINRLQQETLCLRSAEKIIDLWMEVDGVTVTPKRDYLLHAWSRTLVESEWQLKKVQSDNPKSAIIRLFVRSANAGIPSYTKNCVINLTKQKLH